MKNKTETVAFYLTLLKHVVHGFKNRDPKIFSRLTADGKYVTYNFTESRIREVKSKFPKVQEFAYKNFRLPTPTELEYILDEYGKEDKYL